MNSEYLHTGVFKRLSGLVRVRDVVTPFAGKFFEDDTVAEVVQSLSRRGQLGQPVLIESILGQISVLFSDSICDPDDYDPDESLSAWLSESSAEVNARSLREVDASSFLSADTTLFDALGLLHDKHTPSWFVAVEKNQLQGVFQYSDFMKPPARMCLFGMTLEFESVALELCGHFAKHCWDALPEKRRGKAGQTLEKRCAPRLFDLYTKAIRQAGEAGSSQLLLDCTTLADKGTMIRKCNLTAESHSRIKLVFSRVERLRNACAHPGLIDNEVPLELDKLVELVHDCHDLMDSFRRATP